MLRFESTLGGLVAVLALAATPAFGEEDMRVAPAYLQGLRDKGYFELVDELLERLRTDPKTPKDILETIDYEQGRVMIDEASRTGDLVLRKELLDKARGKLVAFTKDHASNPLAPEAFVQLARLHVERGHLAMLKSNETEKDNEKNALMGEARASFEEARTAYTQAEGKLDTALKAYPNFLPEGEEKEKREKVRIALMDAQLQKAVVDYEQGQTFPAGSPQRAEFLTSGLKQFDELYKKYRVWFAGMAARMWQAKCYEEKGELGAAMGIYNELMQHLDPRLRGLQRNVGYFQIILYNKRKEFALADLGGQGWVKAYSSAGELASNEGLGVRFEMAKASLAMAAESTNPTEKAGRIARAVDLLSQVVRYASPHKAEALKLLKEHKPKAAAKFEDVAKLSYEDAISQADEAVASHDFDKAILLLKQAIKRADPVKDPDKAILPRYTLGYCYYMNKRYYEAVVLTEHIARRYPHKPLAPKAAEIGMAALADAYNEYKEIDRNSDLNRLIDLAKYTAEAFTDREEGDLARLTLGQIYHGTGSYPKAIEAFDKIRTKSPKWVEGQTRAGASHWEQSLVLRRKKQDAEADEEVKKALASLNAALKSRQDAGTALTDPELMANLCDIADIQLESGKPEEALRVLEPSVKVQGPTASGPAYNRLISAQLRAHINLGQVDKAQSDMAALEKSGGGTTQLYFGLGKLLQKEMDALKSKGNSAKLAQVQSDYQKFLSALINAKSGQTYDSLQWAGENMLKLGNSKEAGAVFKRITETAAKDANFLGTGGESRLLRTKLKLAAALRGQRDFEAANVLVQELKSESPQTIEPMFEQGMLLEDKAAAGQGKWTAAFAHWQSLASRLGKSRVKPTEYYDAWYHAAYALNKDKQGTKAKQILGGIKRTSPNLGSPEMKQKYEDLLKQIQ
ncbi:tetratricopeptide repeat protein [Singulisphaera sp. PoT]|uniref:tetratricopeptide repeat protein n=1 Tax=Singulisphaera sp. PoT TaxID=3411797 RepID=UPI003BF4608D